jgi:hypothetical protein
VKYRVRKQWKANGLVARLGRAPNASGDAVKLNEVASVSCQPTLKLLEQTVDRINAYP